MSIIASRLSTVLGLTDSLAAGLPPETLHAHNGDARSNTIGEQFWCIAGARESYSRAYDAGEWKGFTCSLDEPHSPDVLQAVLSDSRTEIVAKLYETALDAARETILADLLEHEVQHHGQLIRYFYANGLPFPPAFATRYSLGG